MICSGRDRSRHQRTFKLNTETAICWEIADLFQSCRSYNGVYLNKDLCTKIYAYFDIARFHMSKGWEDLFHKLYYVTSVLRSPHKRVCPDSMIEEYLEKIERKIPRLKRYPK